jgi:hypothetical protein
MVASQELLDALQAVDAAFQSHLGKPDQLCVNCGFSKRGEPEVAGQFARFEGIVREYRRRRLELPVQTIWDESFGHGSALVHGSVRRLTWFVPSILAASLAGGFAETLRRLAGFSLEAVEGERTYHADSPRDLIPSERRALEGFLVAAVRSITPVDPSGIDEMAAVFLLSTACGCDAKALVRAWAERPDIQTCLLPALSKLAELDPTWQRLDPEALVPGASGLCPSPLTALRVFHDQVFTEDTKQYLERRFLAEQDATTAAVLSEAERTVASRAIG